MQISLITSEIRNRLESLLHHWTDSAFVGAMLETGMEEASVYVPETANIRIRALVVLGIRNSALEDMGSTRPYHEDFQSSSSPMISDADMRTITSQAVSYFESAFRQECFHDLARRPQQDIFASLAQSYPLTWKLLGSTSTLNGGERRVHSIGYPPPRIDFTNARSRATGTHSIVASGIDPRLDDTISSILNAVNIGSTDLVFFPAFKWFTRNTEKLFRVFEFILCKDAHIVTLNYFFSRNVVCKRRFLLPPSHNSREIAAQITDRRGLCKRHREALAQVTAPG